MTDTTTAAAEGTAEGTTETKAEGTLATTKVEGATEGEGKTEAKVEGTTETKTEAKPAAPAPIDLAKLTLPEGFKADDPRLKSINDIISDEKLSPQERMQKLVDAHAAALKTASEEISTYWGNLQKEWGEANKSVYGPEPAKHPTIISIGKAIDSLGEKPAAAFREALDMSGMGNHPAIIAALGAWAKQLVEPRSQATGSPGGQRPTLADAIFGNPNSGT